ncbi:glucose-6-phosphate isomerase [Protaetiibacter mangrovi]|uniref:Glucose-6-phosphate isomerase n=1 Tax=Protaetiibacter mangrovi TaxID=2970926 RepID=A0ABT1ZC28_9MICO|nr:glucose-6-phosphate isomerase [Protaetiibacter mangrovi]MCS0498257.1 glucose-6-phosphate isomerase [Protaetiibacter mangrovi]TPX02771.1 glucose-6-phosphate isomerase [Schumannella luteola]
MTVTVVPTGAAAEAVERHVPQLISDGVAGRITTLDATLWGPEAEDEASKRLGWTEAVAVSEGLVDDILALRDELRAKGVDHIVLGGMGGSSLAPEVIANTYGVALTVLDSTDPAQVRSALEDRLAKTAVVISSKSGSTVETDSQKRVYEQAFRSAGIDPTERIVVVTDPGSPLDQSARADGYRVFNADPTVGGRYSALTAFGLVPSGLAGVDIAELLDEAQAVSLELALDAPNNPGLVLGAAIAGTAPLRDKLGIVSDGTHIVGFGDWVEQLIAESTGKNGTGILPVVLDTDSFEVTAGLPDVQIVRLVADERATREVRDGEIEVSGSLGGQLLVWEYATAVAGRLLGINPFDQPDVESAKIAARGLLDARPEPVPALFTADGVEVRTAGGLEIAEQTLDGALDALLAALPADGYVSVQAYLDRPAFPGLPAVRDALARRSGRPVTFGWGPRFLHSTGQFHKGGPAVGVFLQIVGAGGADLEIPDRPFTFGQLIQAQAAGDASVLADHGRPVLTLTLPQVVDGVATLRERIG